MPALIRYLVVALIALPIVGIARTARATTITVSPITRSASTHPNSLNPTWISRADCLADDALSIPLLVTDAPLSSSFEVWASAGANDCSIATNRNSAATAVCGLVTRNSGFGTTTPVLELHDQDILHALAHPGSVPSEDQGTTGDCTSPPQTNPLPQQFTLWLMFVDSGGVADSGSITQIVSKFALLGPSAPSGVSVGPGDQVLKLDWTAAAVGTVSSYAIFCDPKQGTEGDAGFLIIHSDGGSSGSGGSGGGTQTDAAVCTDASTGSAQAEAGDDAGDDDAGSDEASAQTDAAAAACVPASSTAASGADAAAAATSSFCGSGVLVAGTTPDGTNQLVDKYQCATVDGSASSSGLVSNLKNGFTYAVSIAALDALGNIGPLSGVLCDTPTKVSDFYTVYRTSGGTAGGSGFCSVSHVGRAAPRSVAFVALGALFVLAARRRRGTRSALAPSSSSRRAPR